MKTPPVARRAMVTASVALAMIGSSAVTLSATAAPAPTAPPETQALTADRIFGSDRYATAAAVARAFPGSTDTVVVATGQDFADALTSQAGPAALGAASSMEPASTPSAGLPVPKLLTRTDSLPSVTADALADLAPTTIVVVGGTGAVSTAV